MRTESKCEHCGFWNGGLDCEGEECAACAAGQVVCHGCGREPEARRRPAPGPTTSEHERVTMGLVAIVECDASSVGAALAAAWESTRYTEASVTMLVGGSVAMLALYYLAQDGCADDLDPDGERAEYLAEALGNLPGDFESHLEDLAVWTERA